MAYEYKQFMPPLCHEQDRITCKTSDGMVSLDEALCKLGKDGWELIQFEYVEAYGFVYMLRRLVTTDL